MTFSLRIFLLACLIFGTFTQDFDLFDALDDVPTKAPPKDPPKAPEKPKDPSGEMDLLDALDFGPAKPTPKPVPKPTPKPVPKPKQPAAGGDSGFDLTDALGPDPNPKPKEPAKPPQTGGGGGDFGINDLLDVDDGSYEPDGGKSRIRDQDPNDEPQAEAGSGQIAGIASAVGMAILGAASSYFAYQKKKLCFKIQGGVDPESGKGQRGTQSDPQVFSNLLRSS